MHKCLLTLVRTQKRAVHMSKETHGLNVLAASISDCIILKKDIRKELSIYQKRPAD